MMSWKLQTISTKTKWYLQVVEILQPGPSSHCTVMVRNSKTNFGPTSGWAICPCLPSLGRSTYSASASLWSGRGAITTQVTRRQGDWLTELWRFVVSIQKESNIDVTARATADHYEPGAPPRQTGLGSHRIGCFLQPLSPLWDFTTTLALLEK